MSARPMPRTALLASATPLDALDRQNFANVDITEEVEWTR